MLALEGVSRNWTMIGNLASPWRATVDGRGLVTPARGWSLDWWIGAEDRWHFPSSEASLRQSLLALSPVVVTAMRVPGGDAVCRTYAVAGSGPYGEQVIVEVENCSAVPFALGVSVRPFGVEGPAVVNDIVLEDDRAVIVDGRHGLLLPRAPSISLLGTRATGDVATRLSDPSSTALEVHCPDGMAHATFIFPLSHRSVMRVAIPLEVGSRRLRPGGRRSGSRSGSPVGFPPSVSPAASVARGWEAQTYRGVRLVLPEGRLADAVEANRRQLLLFHRGSDVTSGVLASEFSFTDAAVLLGALDRYGFHDEVGEVLRSYPARQRVSGRFDGAPNEAHSTLSALEALDDHWRLTRDETLRAALQPSIARGTRWLRRRPGTTEPDTPGPGPSVDIVRTMELAGVEMRRGERSALCRLQWLIDRATTTFTWPEVVLDSTGEGCAGDGNSGLVSATFLSFVRDLLVREIPALPDSPTPVVELALCSMLPESWAKQPVEIHDAPTAVGRLSFALRWHGSRPALLWELSPHPGLGSVLLRAPGLDASWSTEELSGDALLAQ